MMMSRSSNYPAGSISGKLGNGHVRYLDPIEQQMARFSREYNGHMRTAGLAGFDRPINVSLLKDALLKMQRRYPISRCKLYGNKLIEQISENLVIPLHVHHRQDDKTWKQIWAQCQRVPLVDGSSPIEVHVVNGSNRSEIMFIADHYATDGISMTTFNHELFQAMSNPSRKWEELDWAPAHVVCANKVMWSPVHKAAAVARFVYDISKSLMFAEHVPQQMPAAKRNADFDQTTLMSEAQVSADVMATLRTIAKKKLGVTANPVLTSAAMAAVASMIRKGSSKVSAQTMIDMRRVYGAAVSPSLKSADMGYHANPHEVFALFESGCNDVADMWKQVPKLQAQFTSKRSILQLFAPSIALGQVMKFAPKDHTGPSLAVSNVGRLLLDESYGPNVGELEWFHPVINWVANTFPFVAFTSFRGRLDITVFGSPRHFTAESIDHLAKTVASNIIAMANSDLVGIRNKL